MAPRTVARIALSSGRVLVLALELARPAPCDSGLRARLNPAGEGTINAAGYATHSVLDLRPHPETQSASSGT